MPRRQGLLPRRNTHDWRRKAIRSNVRARTRFVVYSCSAEYTENKEQNSFQCKINQRAVMGFVLYERSPFEDSTICEEAVLRLRDTNCI